MKKAKLCVIGLFASFFSHDIALAALPMPTSFADTVEKISPAVVSISSTQSVKDRRLPGGFSKMPSFPGGGSALEDFFKDFLDPREQGESFKPKKATALGSGVIIDSKEGYIVTAAHVIADAEKIMVTLSDGTELESKLVGKDKRRDIALLKVETTSQKPLPFAQFSDSSKVRQGDWVIAIGNPHNLGNTVTVGVVSARARDLGAKSRDIEATQFIDDFIQTDAAVNQGNSGGPSFNSSGEIIGINVVILSETGGSIGLGFAVPSNTVQKIIEQLKQFGHTRDGRVGVEIQDVSSEIAESINLGKPRGVMVTRVIESSPAEKAQMQVGDIILKVQDKDVKDMRSARKLISEAPIDVEIPIVVWRNNAEKTLTVTAEEVPEANKDDHPGDPLKEKDKAGVGVLGMKLRTLDAELRKFFDIDEKTKGVVVVGFEKSKGIPLDRDTLIPGDVIIQVDGQTVDTPENVILRVEDGRKRAKKNLLFQIHRKGRNMFIALSIEEDKIKENKDNADIKGKAK